MTKVKLILTSFALLLACAVLAQTSDLPPKAIKKFNEAFNAFEMGQYNDAEKTYKALIKKYPGFVDAYDALAKLYQTKKALRPAINAYENVLQIRPDHYFALYELGTIYQGLNQFDTARFYYSRFITVYGNNKDPRADVVKRRLNNMSFIVEAMANPVDIKPINLGSKVNSPFEEYSPALTIDESVLYFTFRDPAVQNEDIHFAQKENEHWKQSRNIGPPINTRENEGAFSVSADGNFIFFTACSRSGGLGQCDIWLTMNKQGRWTTPRALGKPINSRHWESQPSIASNGRDLYFTSDRPGGYGGTDIWKSSFVDGKWSEPANLGSTVNTSGDEQFPFIHPDGRSLYFSSEGHPGMGKSDLFLTQRVGDNQWSRPQNLGYPINSVDEDWNLIVARDGKTAYYSSNKAEGYGGMDIYSFELPETSRAELVSFLRGHVRDAETKEPLAAWVSLTPLDQSTPTEVIASADRGDFIVPLVSDISYALNVKMPGYLFYSDHFDMPNRDASEPYDLYIDLEKVSIGKGVVLRNIFFDTDKFDLKPESNEEISQLVGLLTDNPTVHIEIGGHTDNVGSAAHNKTLSENRAKSVYNVLISNGISENRLSYKGYGSSEPIASNATEEGRAQNRRTAFTIIK